ncbi:M56 family metallopeptidase [Rudaeicoccus suwonensis]|uniref:Zn-dependent protease with chaperone function n=1 Tax=Rudaeicoccus suwonensis TaxID=657409 RepID=A0A561E6M7_9MICO|nr:M56 family metallopeptidase [Rudaeicoccus suwonensis]TWE11273.1 Zn-dependent protease with chaperone function [Rudaeicoccus suwonensis]
MLVAPLVVVAVVLTWPVPRLLPRLQLLDRCPGSALILWQAVSLSAVFAGVCLAPLIFLQFVRHGTAIPNPRTNLPLLVLGLAISALFIGRLLLQGDRVGRGLRRSRREHAELVDTLGLEQPTAHLGSEHFTVLAHATPTAYCIPGRHQRVVLTNGTIAALPTDELEGVLAHERAHLRQRHDLVLEFFTVLHTAVPERIRSDRGLVEVSVLIELLADQVAVTEVGPVAVARALVALASGSVPDATLGAGGLSAERRLARLADPRRHRATATIVLLAAVVTIAVPGVLAWGSLIAWL